jgi:hypothetical protein
MRIELASAVFGVALCCLTCGMAAAAQGDLDGQWIVIADSDSEELRMGTVEDSGQGELEARIGDRIFVGFIEGNHIVLRGDGVVLTGWVGRDATGGIFLAGRRRETTASGVLETGWFATRRPTIPVEGVTTNRVVDTAASSATVAAATVDDAEATDTATQAGAEVIGPTAESTPPVQQFDLDLDQIESSSSSPSGQPTTSEAESDQTIFTGEWSGSDGVYLIQQDGRKLTVRKPSGEIVQGRQTGDAALMVGFRVGCCRGELQPAGTIEWQDGAIWSRQN